MKGAALVPDRRRSMRRFRATRSAGILISDLVFQRRPLAAPLARCDPFRHVRPVRVRPLARGGKASQQRTATFGPEGF
jgi:hypothetical protein